MPRRPKKSNPSYSPLFPRLARAMARIGAERSQIAEAFEVTEEVLQDWLKEHAEFAKAVEEGEKDANAAVEQALFKRATGYSQMEDKVCQYRGEAITVPTMKHYPPDVAAMKLWLANRASGRWTDKQGMEHAVTEQLGEVMKRIRGRNSEQ
jgi:hypothetical protein